MAGPPYPDRPYVGVLAIVERDGRYLLVQRKNPPDQHLWGFPGGTLELGERVFACAERELMEETGISAEPREIITTLDILDVETGGRVRYHYVLICVLAEWRAGEGEAADDAAAMAWVEPAALAGYATSVNVARVMTLASERAAQLGLV